LHGIDFVKQRLQQHSADRQPWVREKLPQDLEDMLGGPIFAGLVDLVNAVEGDEQARTAIYLLLAYLIDELRYDEAFQTTVTAGADLMQMLVADADLVPLAHLAGRALAPELGIVDTHLALAHQVRRLDGEATLGQLLRNLHQQTRPGECPMQAILDAIVDVDRLSPGSIAPFSPEDYYAIFSQVRSFVEDDRRGLTKFVEIIKNRKAPAPGESR